MSVSRSASSARRSLDDVQFMEHHIGEEFTGVISGISNYGFYVELPNTVEGMVRLANLDGDYYVFDEEHYELVGERTIKKSKYAFLLFAISLKPLLFAIILSSFLFQPGTHPTGTYLYIIIPFHCKAMFSGKFSPPIRRVRIISPNQIFLPAENLWSSNICPQRPPGSS